MGPSHSTRLGYATLASDWPTDDVPSFTVHDEVRSYCVPHLALASFTVKRCAWATTEAQGVPATDFDRAMMRVLEDRARRSMPTAEIKCFLNKPDPGALMHCDGICLWQLSSAVVAVVARIAPGVRRTWIILRNRTQVAICFLMTTGLSTEPHVAVAHGLIRAGMLRHDYHTSAFTVGMPVYPVAADMVLLDELLEVLGASPLQVHQPAMAEDQLLEEPVVSSALGLDFDAPEEDSVDAECIEFTGDSL